MRQHKTLVFVDDTTPGVWGYYCLDCDEHRFGFSSDIRPGRLAAAHERDTSPVLQETH